MLRAIMDISARAFSLADKPQRAIRVTSVRMRREYRTSISSWPTTWNEFLPISMPITAIAGVWDMACSLSLVPLAQLRLLAGQEHGRTIPLAFIAGLKSRALCAI
jgi:hypothetical protein